MLLSHPEIQTPDDYQKSLLDIPSPVRSKSKNVRKLGMVPSPVNFVGKEADLHKIIDSIDVKTEYDRLAVCILILITLPSDGFQEAYQSLSEIRKFYFEKSVYHPALPREAETLKGKISTEYKREELVISADA